MKVLAINDKSLKDSYIEIEKLKETLRIFLKRNCFILKTEVECNDTAYESLLSFLRKIAYRQTDLLEWSNAEMSFKIIAKYDTCIYNDLVLRFEVINNYYQGSIHLEVGADYLLECIDNYDYCMICHDRLSFFEGDEKMAFISFKFLDTVTCEDCLNYNYRLNIATKYIIIDKNISILDEERLNICKGLENLLFSGTPFAIKMPDTFDAFWFKYAETGFYLLENGWVADLEWEQNEIVFKGLLVSYNMINNIYKELSAQRVSPDFLL